MNTTIEWAKRLLQDLRKWEVREEFEIKEIQWMKEYVRHPEDLLEVKSWQTFANGSTWGGKDQHAFFSFDVEVNEKYPNQRSVLSLETVLEGWDAINPQFMVFIDGKFRQGMDINHREIVLQEERKETQVYHVDLQGYTGMRGDIMSTLTCKLKYVDAYIHQVIYDIEVLVTLCETLDVKQFHYLACKKALKQALILLNLNEPYSSTFYNSLQEVRSYIVKKKQEWRQSPIQATCIGHTHIDVAWQWTVTQTREKAARSFATVLELMRRYPDYYFISSQPQLYEFVKEDYPDLYAEIKERVQEGRWECEGGMWVEADCNLPSGESLIRQFIYGKRFFKEEFHIDSKVLWLPDVFGFCATLPQIAKQCGIQYFMTTKLSWNQFNRMPHDTFYWKGIDGTKLLTHFITTTNPYQREDDMFATYNGYLEADSVHGSWKNYKDKELNQEVLIAYGWGDGGGGSSERMIEHGRRLNQSIETLPAVKFGKVLPFFQRLEEKVADKAAIWDGELYYEYHRGTYTSMGRNKRDNQKSEMILQEVEKLYTLLSKELPYPKQELDACWKAVLLNQFHDILPGSAIKEVYEDSDASYQSLFKIANALKRKALQRIADHIPCQKESIIVVNTLPWIRSDYVQVQLEKDAANLVLYDSSGCTPLTHVEGNQYLAFVKDIPAMGYRVFTLGEKREEPSNEVFVLTKNGMENRYYRITFDESFVMTSIYDKEIKAELLSEPKGNLLTVYEDKPRIYDNWDIDVYYKYKSWDVVSVDAYSIKELGPGIRQLFIERSILHSKIKQTITFYQNKKRIDFDTYVDWKQHNMLLKVSFPHNINTNYATFEIPYGNLRRETHNNTSWDQAKFEVCGHRWVDVSQYDHGIALLSKYKFGYEAKGKILSLSLVKAGTDPNPDTDIEEHHFTYALYPHEKDWKESDVVQQAYELHYPLNALYRKKQKGDWRQTSFIQVFGNSVLLEVIKKSEENHYMVLRLYEYKNGADQVKIITAFTIDEVWECNALEEEQEYLPHDKNSFIISFKPYEIKTIKLKRK